MMMYAGIGSRETPPDILKLMSQLSKFLFEREYVLRSGGAKGADLAFEKSVTATEYKQIFYAKDATLDAIRLASRFHPAWERCDDYARKLHGRNSMILLGKDLEAPVDFVIAWTKDGKATGGTGLGIRIAERYNIPIYNLFNKEDKTKLKELLNSMK